MDSYLSILIILIILLILSAFFSASETALTGANKIRLKNQADSGDKKAALALNLITNYDSTLSTLLVANNIVNILSASLATVFFTNLLGAGGVGISTAITTVAVIIFGEVLPKSFANEQPEKMIKASCVILNILSKILTPVVKILNLIKQSIKPKSTQEEATPSVTEEELMCIIDEIEDEGVLEENQAELVQNAIEFNDIFAGEILTPRVDITAVSTEDSVDEVKELFFRYNFSRMPVYENSIDHICGFISQKDMFAQMLKSEDFDWHNLIKPCLYVPPKKKIIDLMHILQKQKIHMAVVTDEYGGTLGIVTLEDILEELVGDIWDEHDEITQFITPLDDGSFDAVGEIAMDDLYKAILDTHNTPIKEFVTLSAYLLENMNKIPEKGEVFTDAYFRYTVLEISENRILKVNISLLTPEDFEI